MVGFGEKKNYNISIKLRVGTIKVKPQSGSFTTETRLKIEFERVAFCGGRKTEESREKPSEQRREPTC